MSALILDTETTGKNDPILLIEAAWLKVEDVRTLSIIDTFSQRYKPSKPIETGAMAVHHIFDEELNGCPASDTFRLPDDVEYLVGHNIDYDWGVIGKPPVKRICTLAIARKLWPDADSHSQSALLYRFATDRERVRNALKSAHSAESDVRFCRMILRKEVASMPQQPASWEALWEFSEQARIPEVMPFGKHYGVPIRDLPKDYVRWALGNLSDMDEYLRKALESVH
jgi:exodeoxyribonuclease X